MFTGLVEAKGRVERATPGGDEVTLELATDLDPGPVGSSLAIDGTCLTVVKKADGRVAAVVGPETLRKTTLGALKVGDEVNLERPLKMGDRLGGHLLLGHVDGVGVIERRAEIGPAAQIWITAPPEVMRYVILKGSVAVDGISLTINQATETAFEVTLVPHTRQATTLDRKPPGARVNLEADVIGKYVERLLAARAAGLPGGGGVTLALLKEHGFAD
ncbi:MAG TPA: riboflavin synthase [Polyangia bacterium]|nr:riboflavin synthase [Polyangia bacterium]